MSPRPHSEWSHLTTIRLLAPAGTTGVVNAAIEPRHVALEQNRSRIEVDRLRRGRPQRAAHLAVQLGELLVLRGEVPLGAVEVHVKGGLQVPRSEERRVGEEWSCR